MIPFTPGSGTVAKEDVQYIYHSIPTRSDVIGSLCVHCNIVETVGHSVLIELNKTCNEK